MHYHLTKCQLRQQRIYFQPFFLNKKAVKSNKLEQKEQKTGEKQAKEEEGKKEKKVNCTWTLRVKSCVGTREDSSLLDSLLCTPLLM